MLYLNKHQNISMGDLSRVTWYFSHSRSVLKRKELIPLNTGSRENKLLLDISKQRLKMGNCMAISITSASNKQTANFKSNETAEPILKSLLKNKLKISS